MKKFNFIIVYSSGNETELSWVANDYKDARNQLWKSLSDQARDNIESIECVCSIEI